MKNRKLEIQQLKEFPNPKTEACCRTARSILECGRNRTATPLWLQAGNSSIAAFCFLLSASGPGQYSIDWSTTDGGAAPAPAACIR